MENAEIYRSFEDICRFYPGSECSLFVSRGYLFTDRLVACY
ncbi:MAG: hypothetical protein QXJ97_03690 [Desulfurococcaceae archaeon]